MVRKRKTRWFIRWCYRTLIMVTSLAVVTGVVIAVPAQAASSAPSVPSGNFTLTLSASDLGIDASYLQTAVSEINSKDARENISLSAQVKRNVAEFGGDPSGWVDAPMPR